MDIISCWCCKKNFSQKKNLYRHLRNVHNQHVEYSKHNNLKKGLICPVCEELHATYDDLRKHLFTKHNTDFKTEVVTFSSKEDFLQWKNAKEKELKCRYTKSTGTKEGGRSYYLCHRSYLQSKDKPKEIRVRRLKRQGIARLNFSCPSTLQLTECDEMYKAVLYLPHIGHTCSLQHINLTKNERSNIADKIAEGIPFEKILEDVRECSSPDGTLDRVNLLKRQDLRNIAREFSLPSPTHKKIAQYEPENIEEIGNGTWKILDKMCSYFVRKAYNAHHDTNSECEQFCKECRICIHDFVCTCSDDIIANKNVHQNICKHIHVIAQLELDSVCGELRESVDMEENIESLLDHITEHEVDQITTENVERIKTKLEKLYTLVTENLISYEAKLELEECLDKFIDLLSNGTKKTSDELVIQNMRNRFEITYE